MNNFNPKKVKTVHSLTNTYSGVAGEMRAAAEFVRCGLKVSKPYWTDDEVDLLILIPEKDRLTPLPIQVKSIQFNPDPETQIQPPRKPIQGLKKKYIERQVALCLVVYRPDTDDLWFFSSAQTIRDLYTEQFKAGIKEKSYDAIAHDADVPIAIELKPSKEFNDKYLWKDQDRLWLTSKLFKLARELDNNHGFEKLLETALFSEEEVAEKSTMTMPLGGFDMFKG